MGSPPPKRANLADSPGPGNYDPKSGFGGPGAKFGSEQRSGPGGQYGNSPGPGQYSD